MIRRLLTIAILSASMLTGLDAFAAPAPKGWESVKAERADTKEVAKSNDVSIKSFRGGIQVTTSHPAQIKIFTILGQMVSSDTLAPGTYQFMIAQRGMYIIKVGEITCKVVI